MNSTNWKELAEIVGIAAIILSLLLVAYELRQSTAIATSQAVFDLNSVLDESYRARAQDEDLDELIARGHADPESLSVRERSQFYAWLRADMNIKEATWFYWDRGIIPREETDGIRNSICSRVASPGGREYWHNQQQFFSTGFRETIDEWCD